jgi:hypothetical protein
MEMCFENMNPTRERFNEGTHIKIANCFVKYSQSLKAI